MSDIEGKVVVITGASSGIGEATALLLAEGGAAAVLGARRTERLDGLVEGIRGRGGQAVSLGAGVTRREDLERLVDRAVEEFGRLDALVSNAGISKIGPMTNLDVDGWSAMIDVNLRGVLYGIAAALPVFRRQGRGHFVTTVSTAGLKIVPTQAVYAATKNAVRTLLEGLRQESTDGVVRTTSISPGYVRTELADSIDDPQAREQIRKAMAEFAIPPQAVARAIAFAIDQPADVEIGDITIRPAIQRAWEEGRVLNLGDGETQTRMLGAAYHYDPEVHTQVFRWLPEVVHVRNASDGTCLEDTVRLLGRELSQRQFATDVVLNRLVDILLIQVLRVWLDSRPPQPEGSLLGVLADPLVTEAMLKLHEDPSRDWTASSLAAEVSVSRTTLLRRFASATGQTPGAHLTRWRMDLAALRLRDGDAPIEEIAHSVGYTSVYAFTRAFSRSHALPPGKFRTKTRAEK